MVAMRDHERFELFQLRGCNSGFSLSIGQLCIDYLHVCFSWASNQRVHKSCAAFLFCLPLHVEGDNTEVSYGKFRRNKKLGRAPLTGWSREDVKEACEFETLE